MLTGSIQLHNELRWNPLLRIWNVVSTKRESRPWRAEGCPFCPGKPETGFDWDVLVLDNRFPSLAPDATPSRESFDLYKVEPAYGYCKVVIETPEHTGDLDTIPFRHLVKYIKTLQKETSQICHDPKIRYVAIFRNKGKSIGVSLTHPHSQIYALPFIPPRIKVELNSARDFYNQTGECIFCHILGLEKKEKKRLIYSNGSFTVFLPFFAMWPYEVSIYSDRHVSKLPELNGKEVEELADAIRVTVAMYNSLFGFSLPYIMVFHQAPCRHRYTPYHFHIEFYPAHSSRDKLKYAAGIELGSWVFTYDDSPEEKAFQLKEALTNALSNLKGRVSK